MTKKPDNREKAEAATSEKKAWVAPRLDKIDAGEAEVGTRMAPDGAFTSS